MVYRPFSTGTSDRNKEIQLIVKLYYNVSCYKLNAIGKLLTAILQLFTAVFQLITSI